MELLVFWLKIDMNEKFWSNYTNKMNSTYFKEILISITSIISFYLYTLYG